MLMKRNPLLVLIWLLIAVTPAFSKDQWTKVQSKNFTLVGNASESDMRKIAFKLEQFRQTLSLILRKASISTPVPTTVVLFKSDDSFRPFKPRYQGKIKQNVGGYFLPGRFMNYIALNIDKESVNPYEVIFHEYEHFVLHNSLVRLPLWLDEGLAEFYSTFETDGEVKVKIGVPLSQHIYQLRSQPLLPFKTLLSVDHKSPHYNESSKAGMFYAESWALVHYLMNGNEMKRQQQLVSFISLLDSGMTAEQIFLKAFGVDFTTVENELDAYVRRFLFPVLSVTLRQQLNTEKDMTATQLSRAELQYYQGDLLFRLGQLAEARGFLEKSIELDSKFADGCVALGVLRLAQKQETEAEQMFQSAIQTDSKNYLAHYYYAAMLASNEKYDEAISHYKQAINLKPDIGLFYSDLGYAYLRTGNETEAIQLFQKGSSVDRKQSHLYRTMGYLHFRRGEVEMSAGDAYNYINIEGWRDEHSQYMFLLWYFSLRQLKRDDFAKTKLLTAVAQLDPTAWPYAVLQYLNGSLSLSDLLIQAKTNDEQTEAHAYAGLDLSLKGERDTALEHLRWVRDNGNRRFVEYQMAIAEIAKLESKSQAPGQPSVP
jgi:tetratricopeptide (TPR) repeat protein